MKRALRITGRVLSLLPIIFNVLVFVGFRWGLTPLPKPPPGIRLEPLSPPLKPDEVTSNNAAFYYLKAAQLIKDYKQSEGSRKEMEAVLAGDFSEGTTSLEQMLNDCSGALALLRQGTVISVCQMPWRTFSDSVSDDWKPFRQLAWLECCAGRLALRKGRSEEAAEHYLTVIKLGNDSAKGGPYLSLLVGYALSSRGYIGLRAEAAEGTPTTNSLKHLIERLHQLGDDTPSPAEALRYEVLDSEQMFDSLVMTNRWASLAVSKSAMHRVSEAVCGDFIQEVEKPFWQSDAERIVRKWDDSRKPIWMLIFNRPMVSILGGMPASVLATVPEKAARHETEKRATSAFCGVQQYKISHGKPPERLSDLVPKFLTVVPTDPFDGKPMRYRRESDGWVLWSVGSDRVDNNAAWHEYKYRDERGKHDGGDIYFKSTEPQDDLQEFLKRKKAK